MGVLYFCITLMHIFLHLTPSKQTKKFKGNQVFFFSYLVQQRHKKERKKNSKQATGKHKKTGEISVTHNGTESKKRA